MNNANRQNTTINWYPGHMAKTKRLIEEKYNLIDIVYELVDARIPFSSKIKDIDNILKNKPRILIMTKKIYAILKKLINGLITIRILVIKYYLLMLKIMMIIKKLLKKLII